VLRQLCPVLPIWTSQRKAVVKAPELTQSLAAKGHSRQATSTGSATRSPYVYGLALPPQAATSNNIPQAAAVRVIKRADMVSSSHGENSTVRPPG